MNAESPGSVTTVLLPKLAIYEYYGSIRIPDGADAQRRGAAPSS